MTTSEDNSSNPSHVGDFASIIHSKIEGLRLKLLDLSRSNPLIAARLNRRSGSVVQVVDELPDVLFSNLSSGSSMRFVPLPPLDQDPRDEERADFQAALKEAHLSDELYKEEIAKLDNSSPDSLDEGQRIDRELRDRVREKMGMPARVTSPSTSLSQHAKNNEISPAFDLPDPDSRSEDGRYSDEDIQTLLLPGELERKLNSISTRSSTWLQESGINVLHAAFGFLEWREPNSERENWSPLILLPVELKKHRTPKGPEFWVDGCGEDAEVNLTLREKLKQFGFELPPYMGGSIEDYFAELDLEQTGMPSIRIRRQIAFGVFPSSRMAMYEDLDTSKGGFEENQILKTILFGSEPGTASPFGDEGELYDVDSAEIEKKVPHLVLDADSSQFHTLIDLANGKNIAVEGPPGTGKSQTIVNAIANALSDGKKVLFVASKMAALEVVKNRLESVGLGAFVLPLQAERSSRQDVIQSIRDRVNLAPGADTGAIDGHLSSFRDARHELSRYISLVGSEYKNTGLTVHEILGKNIATQKIVESLPVEIQRLDFASAANLTGDDRQKIVDMACELAKSAEELEVTEEFWRGATIKNIDRFHLEEISNAALETQLVFADLSEQEKTLQRYDFYVDKVGDDLGLLQETFNELVGDYVACDFGLVEQLLTVNALTQLESFFEACAKLKELRNKTGIYLKDPSDFSVISRLEAAQTICEMNNFGSFNVNMLLDQQNIADQDLIQRQALAESFKLYFEIYPQCSSFSISDLQKAGEIAREIPASVVAIRNNDTAAPGVRHLLLEASSFGQKLAQTALELRARIAINDVGDPHAVRQMAAQIEASGALSFLSSEFRAARRRYMAISSAPKFDKLSAIKDLKDLAAWLDDKSRFEKFDLSRLLREHDRGLDTDFQSLEELVRFYDTVDENLAGLERQSIRSLLKEGDIEMLRSIPSEPKFSWDSDYASLLKSIDEGVDRRSVFDSEIERLRQNLVDFREVERVTNEIIESLIRNLRAVNEYEGQLSENTAIEKILGRRFRGTETEPENLEPEIYIARSVQHRGDDFKSIVLKNLKQGTFEDFRSSFKEYFATWERSRSQLDSLVKYTGQSPRHFIRGKTADEVSRFIQSAIENISDLFLFSRFAKAKQAFEDYGHPSLADALDQNRISFSRLPAICKALIARSMAKSIYRENGSVLNTFSGSHLEDLRDKLVEQDKAIISETRDVVKNRLARLAAPPPGISSGKKSDYTEWGLLEHEISKKKRFVSVRDLTSRAGNALQELKPCWMMSPLAVAQYIPRKSIEFDLCIIDEASQMPPEDALGALLRSKQTMIVGDTNQLPPTSFFRRMIDDEDADEDETLIDESILESANIAFRPKRRLRWHYRSRHSGLINFSNRLVYDDELITFPSANEDNPNMGVSLTKVPGEYKSGRNPIESKVMIEAAIKFIEEHPRRSLGLVTLNSAQRDLLMEDWEYAIRHNRLAQDYLAFWEEKDGGLEQFFIKNLENVQGDERDVIFIGTVYGPEKTGAPVMQRFGPVNGVAGRRRLNVLFSRAKEQIVTFSSMTSADISADENGNPGTYMLKRWLEYSSTGLIEASVSRDRLPDSAFEEFVIEQIQALGCEAIPQVGAKGYFIDIGVKHPAYPDGFILGVECDGASYHSTKSARDRDRLRQEVLEGLGWHFHRIWSTDWFNDPQREIERLKIAITERLEEIKRSEKTAQSEVDKIAPDHAPQSDAGAAIRSNEINGQQPPHRQNNGPSVNRVDPVPIGIGAGDSVQIEYENEPGKVHEYTLSKEKNDPVNGIVHVSQPLGQALLGADEEDDVDVLIGNRLRKVRVIKVISRASSGTTFQRNTHEDADLLGDAPEAMGDYPESSESEASNAAVPKAKTAVSWSERNRRKVKPEMFYEDSYRFVIRALAKEMIENLGPISVDHLSEKIARLHGFQRTGQQIKRTIWQSINRDSNHTRVSDRSVVFWPTDTPPSETIKFRGLGYGGEQRSWRQVPYPEKLGLAVEALSEAGGVQTHLDYMSAKLDLRRVTAATKGELEDLLREAERLGYG